MGVVRRRCRVVPQYRAVAGRRRGKWVAETKFRGVRGCRQLLHLATILARMAEPAVTG
jgi:hypothetical protein